jgi:hypothetical protein
MISTRGLDSRSSAELEAIEFGGCFVVHNIPENIETIGDAGFTYDGMVRVESLRQGITASAISAGNGAGISPASQAACPNVLYLGGSH